MSIDTDREVGCVKVGYSVMLNDAFSARKDPRSISNAWSWHGAVILSSHPGVRIRSRARRGFLHHPCSSQLVLSELLRSISNHKDCSRLPIAQETLPTLSLHICGISVLHVVPCVFQHSIDTSVFQSFLHDISTGRIAQVPRNILLSDRLCTV